MHASNNLLSMLRTCKLVRCCAHSTVLLGGLDLTLLMPCLYKFYLLFLFILASYILCNNYFLKNKIDENNIKLLKYVMIHKIELVWDNIEEDYNSSTVD